MFSIKTFEGEQIEIDKRIGNISKLFKHLIEEYKNEVSTSNLKNIHKKDVILLVDFGKIINFNTDNIVILKPYDLHKLENIKKSIFTYNLELENFYNNLNSELVCDYAKISDFYDVPLLEEIIYLKIYEVFQSTNNINEFFKGDLKDYQIELSNERIEYLKGKYMIYCEKYVNNLSDEEVEKILKLEFNNKEN